MSTGALEVAHELVDAQLVLSFAETGQMGVEGRHHGALVSEIDLDLAEVLALLKKVSGVRVPQRVHMGGLLDAASLEGQAEGPLQGGAAHRLGRSRCTLPTVAFGGEEQGGMTVGLPWLAQQFPGTLGDE